LYQQRVAYSPDETLRRAILTEHRNTPDLAALIRAEGGETDRLQPALPQAPQPSPLILDQFMEETNAKSTRASD
jgi:hypothetical protein